MVRFLIGCLGVIALVAPVPARSAAPGDASAALTEFPNGLRLLVLEQPLEAVARIDVYVSLPGAAQKRGLAHLVEHLMFCSSAGAPNGSLVDSLSLNAGDFGGDTTLAMVHLWSYCLPTRVPQALAIEAERLGRLRPTTEDLEHERLRILGEYELSREFDVDKQIIARVSALAYGAEENAGDPLLGSPEDIAAITMGDVEAFLAEALAPERTVVLVSGPVVRDEVVAAATDCLGTLPGVGPTPLRALPSPLPPGPCWTMKADRVGDVLSVGFRLPCETSSDLALAVLARSIMDRENGNPVLQFYGNEAFLTLNIAYRHRAMGTDAACAEAALESFWDETLRVIRNVGDPWSFERNRAANVKDLRAQAAVPRQREEWRAQRLAAGAALPEVEELAAIIDTLSQARAAEFFTRQFVSDRAYAGMVLGCDLDREWTWRDRTQLRLNPYLEFRRSHDELDAARIALVLAAAKGLPLGKSATVTLPSGVPVRVVTIPGAERVCLGGVRVLPDLFEGRESRASARLFFYETVANAAYSMADEALAPASFEPQMGTLLSVLPYSMSVTAEGDAEETCAVAAAMNKRLQADGMNHYVFTKIVATAPDWLEEVSKHPAWRATGWRLGRIAGTEHPLARWLRPDLDSITSWKRPWAEDLHRRICAVDGLTLLAVGDLTAEDVERCFGPTLGRFRRSLSGAATGVRAAAPGVSGRIIHDDSGEVANVSVTFSGGGPDARADLTPLDLEVIGGVVADRLRIAATEAGLDSLDIFAGFWPVGPQVLPEIDVATSTGQAGRVLDLVLAECAALQQRPVTADEEARVRLLQLGALIGVLGDAEQARDYLVACGRYGAVPVDPLVELCTQRTALLAARAPRLFSAESAAWTVVADSTRVAELATRARGE
ncbi:MAG: insulinase family protein [bacterium]|nr:insulinase family protein [bacterium]